MLSLFLCIISFVMHDNYMKDTYIHTYKRRTLLDTNKIVVFAS